jgi:hypothetical protein
MKRTRLYEKMKGGSVSVKVSYETYQLINELRRIIQEKTHADEVTAHYVIKYAVMRILEQERLNKVKGG